MRVFPIVNKARKPKFEFHISVYDLNNVPLVAGTSVVKWHFPNSIHSEHRGRTSKCSIDKINHRVSYNYSKIVPIRISIDRNNNLTECPIEFEVIQEFPMVPGGRDEKITLGTVRLNLSEYVEESENFPRRSTGARGSTSLDHSRDKSSSSTHGKLSSNKSNLGNSISPTSTTPTPHLEENDVVDEEAEEGIVRRYLMQDSKVNSTLKIGILMVQIDGERNYVAPPLKTAPMFGGIAGIMTGEQVEPEDGGPGALPNLNKSRDTSELQDMYRRSLAASWACQPGEVPADECIEDIFSGGDGWSEKNGGGAAATAKKPVPHRSNTSSSSDSGNHSNRSSGSGDDEAAGGTLKPSDIQRFRHHLRTHSGASDQSGTTITGGRSQKHYHHHHQPHPHRNHNHDTSRRRSHSRHRPGHGMGREDSYSRSNSSVHLPTSQSGISLAEELVLSSPRSRSESLTSLAPTLGSERDLDLDLGGGGARGREGWRRPREVDEYEVRDDLVAWKLPETVV
ncbi:N-terminal C2 in EEIG1 and EHBP1 proteins-domain-containing protein [Xylariomycetidae sp. FL2044]|nr:N-terminal C2 in EEIG1 and EHBP1 proteins-domain-containing protein [Xylariomycetidae sp. FL2044]